MTRRFFRSLAVLAALLSIFLALPVSAQVPPSPIKQTDSGMVARYSSIPMYLSADGNLWRIDSNGVFQTADSNVSVTYMTRLTGSGGLWLNNVKLWDWLSNPVPGQAVKVQPDSSIGFGADLTGSPFFDTVSTVNISYVNAAGDTVMGAHLVGATTYLYNNSGTNYYTGSRFFIPILTLDSAYLASAVASTRLRTNDLYGISGALDFRAPTGQAMTFQQGISGNINWYYGALLYMAMEAGILDGQNRSGIRDFLYAELDSSLIVEGTLGTGFVETDSGNFRTVLGLNGVYIGDWSEVGSTNADSADGVPFDLSGITTGYILSYNGTNIIGAALVLGDSSVAYADSAGAVTHESVQDLVGAMVTGNTETNIAVTYDDVTGTLDFVVAGGVGGLFNWFGTDALAGIIDSSGDTTLQIGRTAGKTHLFAEDGDEVIIGDTAAYARAPHGFIGPAYYKGVPSDTATADSALATQGYVDRNGDEVAFVPFTAVVAASAPDDDSVYVTDNIRRGTSFALFRDSTINGTDTVVTGAVAWCHEDLDVDSLIFSYLTNGSIDTVRVMGPKTGSINADSVYATFTTGWAATTSTRVALALDVNLSAGQSILVDFVDVLTDDNDRTVVEYAALKGGYR